ncbi:1,2-phenylacetyl-CoA epoxidase subunit PaaE [Rurimicrobium arvi]|uniref:Phenylacetate-CoA oxygenase/reductase subunit PaaK n=1 Tax=Rurimicrobium arvi TaxID=2049916 RepID=A0ABP8N0C5_9BACT
MAITFHPLKVKNVRKETADCVSVSLEVPAELQQEFSFRHGQYLTFRKEFNGEEVRRSYSICSSPLDRELRVAIKKVEDGLFSQFANHQLKVGDTLDAMAPQGLFTCELNRERKKYYLAFAAGSGITPILSIIKTVLQSEPQSEFCLVYGNQNRGSIIFKSELEALKNKYMERFSLYNVLSREVADAELLRGRIDPAKINIFLDKVVDAQKIDDVFLCGPEEMILSGKEALKAAGIPEERIHFELFYSATAAEKQKARRDMAYGDDTMSEVTIHLDGSASTVRLGYHGESILDAALRNGADLPFACKGGVCATCRCKVESGEVEMDVNYALEKDELAQGFVLACQAHPRSEQVIVNFDVR